MKLNGINHIFFDLDHTLWDFEKNSALTFEKIFNKNKLVLDLNFFLQTYVPINNKYWKLYRDNQIKKEDLRFSRLRETFQHMQENIPQPMIEQLSEDYILHLSENNFLFEDAISTLEDLHRKYDLHIITNGFEEVQHRKLKNAAIGQFFKSVTTSEETDTKKPHPLIFQTALQKANAEAKETVMIGDNLEADILGAQAVGMNTIFFSPENQDFNGPKISQLKQLLQFL